MLDPAISSNSLNVQNENILKLDSKQNNSKITQLASSIISNNETSNSDKSINGILLNNENNLKDSEMDGFLEIDFSGFSNQITDNTSTQIEEDFAEVELSSFNSEQSEVNNIDLSEQIEELKKQEYSYDKNITYKDSDIINEKEKLADEKSIVSSNLENINFIEKFVDENDILITKKEEQRFKNDTMISQKDESIVSTTQEVAKKEEIKEETKVDLTKTETAIISKEETIKTLSDKSDQVQNKLEDTVNESEGYRENIKNVFSAKGARLTDADFKNIPQLLNKVKSLNLSESEKNQLLALIDKYVDSQIRITELKQNLKSIKQELQKLMPAPKVELTPIVLHRQIPSNHKQEGQKELASLQMPIMDNEKQKLREIATAIQQINKLKINKKKREEKVKETERANQEKKLEHYEELKALIQEDILKAGILSNEILHRLNNNEALLSALSQEVDEQTIEIIDHTIKVLEQKPGSSQLPIKDELILVAKLGRFRGVRNLQMP